MLNTGITGRAETTARAENSAAVMGSGNLEVFATPAMVALMEQAAWQGVPNELEPGQSTVGTLMNIRHLSATPLGMKITAEAVLEEIDRRRLVFTVKAYDEKGLIGEGKHERFIIDTEKFMGKTMEK